ncbi:MAG: hypothetical protein R2851_06650 [Caldilineaceae bacterium]
MGVDTWGVDYGLLDAAGHLLGNPVHYRDVRTIGMLPVIFNRVSQADIFADTGIQFLELNTLIQLYAMRHADDPQLDMAARYCCCHDLFNYWLHRGGRWRNTPSPRLRRCSTQRNDAGPPVCWPSWTCPAILPPVHRAGHGARSLTFVCQETGLADDVQVIAVGSHDTASAVAAVPGLDADSVYISSGTWSLMGAEIAQPVIALSRCWPTTLPSPTKAAWVAPFASSKTLQACGCCRRVARSGRGRGRTTVGANCWRWPTRRSRSRSLVNPDAADFHNPANMLDALAGYCRTHGQPVPETVGQVVRCCLESLALRYRARCSTPSRR